MLKFVFLIIGLIALGGIVLHIGLEPIFHAVSQLGPLSLVIILLPMIVVYGFEAWGWDLTLGAYGGKVGFCGCSPSEWPVRPLMSRRLWPI